MTSQSSLTCVLKDFLVFFQVNTFISLPYPHTIKAGFQVERRQTRIANK